MSELKEEELLEEFEYFTKNIPKHITSDNHSPLNRHGQACQQIREMIQKPEVTEEWIEEKARYLAELFRDPHRVELHKAVINTEFFIRSLFKEAK